MNHFRFTVVLALVAIPSFAAADDKPIVLDGKGPHIVLISGDQEYRSEETIPQLAKILSKHHGFKCTVLFGVDPKDGTINQAADNIPGLEALKSADLMIIFLRWVNLPDNQMQHIADYVAAGKPVVGLRTSTHPFKIPKNRKFAKFAWDNGDTAYKGGFGKQILGETWVNHHGAHGREGTRGIIAKGQEKHPIVKGIAAGDIFGPTDVYTVTLPLPGDSTPIVLGEVTETLKPDSKAVSGKKNAPMMPVAWTKTYKGESDKVGRAFMTTMGASQDFEYEGTRRMIVNGCYWALGLEEKIPDKSNVEIVGTFKASPFSYRGIADWSKVPVKPADLFK